MIFQLEGDQEAALVLVAVFDKKLSNESLEESQVRTAMFDRWQKPLNETVILRLLAGIVLFAKLYRLV